ncbi:ejaculatory bulb-specific protein 3-like [Periplaneta americana]|uniref:ejaculatory bulb-specific protein 3-like n=1 Tax=Periplaneta americana TaxID=6978 RepID=UPI0037E8831C
MDKTVIVGLLCLLAVALVSSDKYTNRYDHIDVDSILRNERALGAIVKCILEKGPCSPEGRELKADLPEALQTDCAKCTDNQKTLIRKAARYLIDNKPSYWNEISNKYDPEKQYVESFNKFLQEA